MPSANKNAPTPNRTGMPRRAPVSSRMQYHYAMEAYTKFIKELVKNLTIS